MSLLWNRHSAEKQNVPTNAGDQELMMLPRWSMVLAALMFLAVQYLFHYVMPHHNHEMMPMRVLMGYSWGTLMSSYILLIGYISRDVKRRGMSAGLWMLTSIVLPGGIGAVVYFLLRQPILARCPNCRTELASDYHFCPQCQFQMAPVCGQCFRGVQITDVYCVQCGHDLEEDHTPARLRSFSS